MKDQAPTLQSAMREWLEVFKYPALQRTSYDRIEATARAQIYPCIGMNQIDKITVEDLQNRAKVSGAIIEKLGAAGALADLPESSQLSLF